MRARGEGENVQPSGPTRTAHPADGVTPRRAPYVTDEDAIGRTAAEIEALSARVAGAIDAAKGRLSDADGEIAALGHALADARREIEALAARLAAATRNAEALRAEAAALKQEGAALRREATAYKAEAESWRTQLYRAERMLIDELDRFALRAIAAAKPDPAADAAAPEVSVITPVFNRPELLVTAVRSVLAQRFANWELIIVDDGSTDDIAGALAPFLADPRIRLVRQTNGGECVARNHGLRLARGEIVAYLDSDNYWYPEFLGAAAKVFRADPALDIAYGAVAYDWPNGDVRFYLLPFDRQGLLRDNLADINVIVHRRRAYERFGGFDELLTRAVEYDLMLRYTEERPAAHIPVMAARYRIVAAETLSGTRPLANNVFRIRRKWWPRPETPPRVLFAAPAFPQANDSQLNAELACMRRFGAVAAVWAPLRGASPGAVQDGGIPVHRGPLGEAIAAFRPDIVHVHGLALLDAQRDALAGVPVTVRGRGADTAPDAIERTLALPNLVRAYLMPGVGGADGGERLRHAAPVFDTTLFTPSLEGKDRRLVLRAAPALPGSDLRFVLELAKRLPHHRVVLAVATVAGHEREIDALRVARDAAGSPADLYVDTPRAELARLFAAAGIVVHSAPPPAPGERPRSGGPASLVEAMASGAYVLARRHPPFPAFVGDAGAVYSGVAEAAALIRATEGWTDAAWRAARNRSIERAFQLHADEFVLRPLFEDWCAIAGARAAAEADLAA